MKICIPVEDNNALDSRVCAHFGSAPFFLIVDTDTAECDSIVNTGAHHAHGMCQPLALLDGKHIDGVVVGGIGRGALFKLQAAGVGVYLSEYPTVRETVAAYRVGTLRPVTPEHVCAGHGQGHGTGMGASGPGCH
jgi:predicted Fe-Mo cluster-binding NifX family protein